MTFTASLIPIGESYPLKPIHRGIAIGEGYMKIEKRIPRERKVWERLWQPQIWVTTVRRTGGKTINVIITIFFFIL